jgi:hypothetical protein
MVKFITILFILFFIFCIYQIIYFIKSFTEHRKVMRKMDESLVFKMMSWGDEIQDESIRQEYVNFCVSTLLSYTSSEGRYDKLPDIKETYDFIVLNYSNYIPSLKSNLRSGKLDKIFS